MFIEEMRLDLRHHDPDALRRHHILLMLLNKLLMQPDVIKHAADGNGNGQTGDRHLSFLYVVVQIDGEEDHQQDKARDPQAPLPDDAAIFDGVPEKVGQQEQTDQEAGRRGRTGMITIVLVDPEADRRKKRREIYGRIDPREYPQRPSLSFRLDDIKEQDQDHRPHGIPADRYGGTPENMRRPDSQTILQQILRNQDKAQGIDEQHDPPVLRPDIGICQHCEREADKQQRERHEQHILGCKHGIHSSLHI